MDAIRLLDITLTMGGVLVLIGVGSLLFIRPSKSRKVDIKSVHQNDITYDHYESSNQKIPLKNKFY